MAISPMDEISYTPQNVFSTPYVVSGVHSGLWVHEILHNLWMSKFRQCRLQTTTPTMNVLGIVAYANCGGITLDSLINVGRINPPWPTLISKPHQISRMKLVWATLIVVSRNLVWLIRYFLLHRNPRCWSQVFRNGPRSSGCQWRGTQIRIEGLAIWFPAVKSSLYLTEKPRAHSP
jgi:hypothetical protein